MIDDKLKKELISQFNKEFPDSPIEEMDGSALAQIPGWISTGNYALNWCVSKSLFKGIPLGRITILSGDPGAGKCASFGTKVKLLNQQEKIAKEYLNEYSPGIESDTNDLIFNCIEFEVNGTIFKIPESSKILTTNRGYVVASELNENDEVFYVS